MLASITPLGERSRRQRWWLTVSALIVGGVAAGAAAGALLAETGSSAPLGAHRRFEVLVVLAALAVGLELVGVRVPTHRRQVDETWLHRYRGWVYGLGFGAQLGVGVWTIVTTAAVYVTLTAELLAPGLRAGALIGAVFGLVRGATVLAAAPIDSPGRLAAFHDRLHRAERTAAWAALGAQAVIVVAAAATL